MELPFRPTERGLLSDSGQLHRSFEQISNGLNEGKSLGDIANELGLSISGLVDLLIYLAGRYGLFLYRVYWSVAPDTRAAVRYIFERWPVLALDPRNLELFLPNLEIEGVSKEEILLTSICENHLTSDAYALIRIIEHSLAHLIRSELQRGYGDKWWREGVPVEIRKDCASAREEDLEPLEEEFQYWTISHMTSILESRWAIFSKILPGRMVADKKGFLSALKKMNRIRNRVMHPIRGYVPTQDDFKHLEDI